MTQEHRLIQVETPLGKDQLLLMGFSGHEELGRPFIYELDMLATKADVDFESLIGKKVTVKLQTGDSEFRYFNGFVNTFRMAPFRSSRFVQFYATVVPWLWLLTRKADCRIFQKKNIPDIIKEVFQPYGGQFEDKLTRNYRKWDYCVQYRETDFNFVSRLMEQEGIYYYIKHEEGNHTVVLCDAPSNHTPYSKYGTMKTRAEGTPWKQVDAVGEWITEKSLLSGKYVHTDYNFTTPKTPLKTNSNNPGPHDKGDYEVYDYPGEYSNTGEGDTYAKTRMDELRTFYEIVRATTDARGLCPGYKFNLEDHPRGDQNKEWLVVSADYRARAESYESETEPDAEGGDFDMAFTAIDASTRFRAARLTAKPTIQGAQTAVVVGPKGEEIYTDKYGRIKVQFHWDRLGKKDENSSCWIRVAHDWAGKKWGSFYLPRIGQEVVVEFLEGDPDCPLVTGSVYNADQEQHYKLPDHKTKSYVKSNSSMGGVGHNEMRFEDKKGQEQIYFHAERNMDIRVKNDTMEKVINDRHLVVGKEEGGKKGDQKEMVYRDKHLKVHRHQEEHIGGNFKLKVGGIDGPGNVDILYKGNLKQHVEKDEHEKIDQQRAVKIGTEDSLEVGNNRQEKIGMKFAVEAGQEIHLKAGMKVIIEGGLQVTLKGPGGFVDIGPAGVTIQGTTVLINSGGAAGVGSGSSPTSAQTAAEASPGKPTEADNSETGMKSC